MKRIISVFIATVLIVISVPCTAVFADTDGYFTYRITDGYATITDVDPAISGEVTVPETLGGYPVTKIGVEAFYKCYDITGIIIPEGVVTLERRAFVSCGADFIQIPDSVTEINGPFSDNHIASDFNIRCHIDSEINRYAYTHMINAEVLKMDEYPDNDGVLRYGYNTEGAVVTGLADKEAEHIVIPETIGGVPVISIVRDAFYGSKTGIKSITFPSTLKYIRDDTRIGGGESGELVLPDGLESIGKFAFSGDNLKKIYIPSSVSFIDKDAFYECRMVVLFGETGSYAETFAAENGIPFNVENIDPQNLVYEIKDGEAILTGIKFTWNNRVEIPETLGGCPVTKIGDGVFKDENQLGSVTLPDTVREIGNEAFMNCFNLRDFDIPDSVTTIGDRAFEGDFQLRLITVGSNVTHIGENAFSGCEVLKIYGDGGSYTETYAKENGIPFNGDDSEYRYLIYEISDGEATVTGCDQVRGEVVIPETLGGAPVTRIGEGAFYYEYSITSVKIPDTVEYIDDYAFGHCGGLTEFTVPSGVKRIGQYAFIACKALEKITFDSIFSLVGIGAFDECTAVTFYLYNDRSAPAFGYAVDHGIPYVILNSGDPVMGDVTYDGKVALADVSLILKYVAGWNVTVELSQAEVTGDGKVNLSDVTRILQYIAGWEVTLG